jgi:hypothetical protein
MQRLLPRLLALGLGVLALGVLALGATACSNPRQPVGALPAVQLPPGWARLRPMLAHGEALAATGDTAGLMKLALPLQAEGLGLLRASVPNALPRHEMPRFLEARAAFGDALVRYAKAHEEGRAQDLPTLMREVAATWRGWMAVISGQAPEREV